MEYFTTEDIAKLLQISPITVQRWLNDGKLKGFKVGQTWRVSKKVLEEYLEQKEKGE